METKICHKCKEKFPITADYFYRDRSIKDGFRHMCKSCANKYRRSPAGKLSDKKSRFKTKYGVTLDERLTMYIMQSGRCAICKQPTALDEIVIDHNHKTEKVRGLLCHWCNIRLATIEDKEYKQKAEIYLEIANG